MANIITNTLKIGSDNLVLRDADAQEQLVTVKDGLSSVENNILTDNIREALLQLASKVAYIDEDGQDYYDALNNALYPTAELVSISAVYTQTGTIYATDSLERLKPDLLVTATYSDTTTKPVSSYTLSGTLSIGTSTITVGFGGKTTTFNVTVSAGFLYVPSMGTLSNQPFFDITGNLAISESVVDDVLNLSYTHGSTSNIRNYVLKSDYFTSGVDGLYVEIKIKLTDIGYYLASNEGGTGYIHLIQFSTSSPSWLLGLSRYSSGTANPRLRYRNSAGKQVFDDTQISLNSWHTFTLSISNEHQIVTMDGDEILNTDVGASSTSSNVMRIGISDSNTNDLSVQIEKIEVKYAN